MLFILFFDLFCLCFILGVLRVFWVLSGSLVCFYGDDCSEGALHALFCVWEKFSGEVFSVMMFSMGRLSGFLYPDIFYLGVFLMG